jgi:hypothetical protein
MSLLEIAEKGEAKVPKPKGVEGLIEVANPNAKQAHLKNVKIKDMDANAAPVELSRRVSSGGEILARAHSLGNEAADVLWLPFRSVRRLRRNAKRLIT